MKYDRMWRAISVGALFFFACGIVLANDTPANVAGTWTITITGDGDKSAQQSLVLEQDGNTLSGEFKGPRQSGNIDGTVAGNSISFHVNARMPLDYKGTVDGDSMKGTFTARGKIGNWTAKRVK